MSAQQLPTVAEHVLPESPVVILKRIWRVLLQRRWLLASIFVASLVAMSLYTVKQQKLYRATCTLIIDLAAPRVLDNQQVQDVVDTGPGTYWYTREYYETQYKLSASRAVASRVVEKLHLADEPLFLGIDQIKDPVLREKRHRQIDPVARAQLLLRVEPVKESRMVTLRVEYPDPNRAAAIANTLAESYIAESLSVRVSATHAASDWLEGQLRDLESKLDNSSKELYRFKKEKDIVSTSFEDKQSMVSQRLVALNDALTKTRIQRAQLQARLEALQGFAKVSDSEFGAGDLLEQIANQQAVQGMKLRLIDLQNECADYRTKYLPNHPKIVSCEERLKEVRSRLKQELASRLEAQHREYQEVRQTEKNLLALYNQAKDEAFKLNQNEEDYQRLKRAMDNNQRLYDLVLKRLKDAGLSGLVQMSNLRIVDRARPLDIPVYPNVLLNLLFAALLGILFGGVAAFCLEYFNTTVSAHQQIEQLGFTFLGIIPNIGKDIPTPELAIYEKPRSSTAECCRSIRTNLLFMSPDKHLQSILVTSSAPQEGKTTIAANIAVAMADSGGRVLLLDADMRRPRTQRIFKIGNEIGLSSVIVGSAKLADAIKTTQVPGLSVLVSGPIPPNPAELLHADAFGSLLRQLETRYDQIIIDSPPEGVVADAAILGAQVDGTIVVMRAGKTTRDHALRTLRSLRNVNARIFGAVLNDLDLDSRTDGYYYDYGRYGSYYSTPDEAPS